MAMTYLLSPQFAFLNKNEFDTAYLEKLAQQMPLEKTDFLHDTHMDSVLVLSTEIQVFLEYFLQPSSFQNMAKTYAEKIQSPTPEVEKTLLPFFNNMIDNGILIPHTLNQAPILKPIDIGDAICHFTITDNLSDEGHVKIYKALDNQKAHKVLLKIIDKRTFSLKKDLKYWQKRLKQEGTILKALQNSSLVCGFIGVFETPDFHILVMEHIEGQNLRQWLVGKCFSSKKNIFKQIIAAYAHIHKCGILHGDIHRSNIMVLPNDTVKIIDFDMAYHIHLKRGELVIEGGVLEYLPPEKISDNYFNIVNDKADIPSEIYQIGVIGYSIFYEKLPFKNTTWQLLREDILKNAPKWGQNTEGVDAFLQKAMHLNPEKRFKTVQDMYDNW